MDTLIHLFDDTQTLLFEQVVLPGLVWLGELGQLEQAYEATGWLLIGLLQLGGDAGRLGPTRALATCRAH